MMVARVVVTTVVVPTVVVVAVTVMMGFEHDGWLRRSNDDLGWWCIGRNWHARICSWRNCLLVVCRRVRCRHRRIVRAVHDAKFLRTCAHAAADAEEEKEEEEPAATKLGVTNHHIVDTIAPKGGVATVARGARPRPSGTYKRVAAGAEGGRALRARVESAGPLQDWSAIQAIWLHERTARADTVAEGGARQRGAGQNRHHS